jgi:hypothetical protein
MLTFVYINFINYFTIYRLPVELIGVEAADLREEIAGSPGAGQAS